MESETKQLKNEPQESLVSAVLPVNRPPSLSGPWLPGITCTPTCPSAHRADAVLAWLSFQHLSPTGRILVSRKEV